VNVDFKNANFKEELGKLDRDKEYLIHCRSGGRSTAAKPVFEELGFKAIYHLDGGFIGWEEAELPVSK
jgi:phage shock protein E